LGFNTHASFDCATTFARARAHGQQPAINQSKKKGVPEEEQEEDDVVVVVGDDEWLCVCVCVSLSLSLTELLCYESGVMGYVATSKSTNNNSNNNNNKSVIPSQTLVATVNRAGEF
jgi:hypothetical protein